MTHTPDSSPFAAIAKYKAIKAVYDAQPAVKTANPGAMCAAPSAMAPRASIPRPRAEVWNGADFASKPRHGGAYSKATRPAGPVLMPVKGHALQGGRLPPPRTVRRVPRGGRWWRHDLCYDSFLAGRKCAPLCAALTMKPVCRTTCSRISATWFRSC